jgi:hypothetical protein
MKFLPLIFLLSGCAGDPLRRAPEDFPPAVQFNAPDGSYATRTGFVVKDGGVAYQFKF